MANQVEERRRDRRHLAPCCSPAAKLLMSRSGFQGHQLHLSSTTWDESPAAILARLLAKIMASEKTVQQLQTQPNFSRCVGPSCPVLVLAQSREMLPVSGPGRGQPFHCRCSPLLGDMQHLLWALLSFCFGDHLGATFYTDICSKSPGVGQKSCSTVLRCQHFLSGWFVVFFFFPMPCVQMPSACSCSCRGCPVSWGWALLGGFPAAHSLSSSLSSCDEWFN